MGDKVNILVNDQGKNREFDLVDEDTLKTLYDKLKNFNPKITEYSNFLIGRRSYQFNTSFHLKIRDFDIDDGMLAISIVSNHSLGLIGRLIPLDVYQSYRKLLKSKKF